MLLPWLVKDGQPLIHALTFMLFGFFKYSILLGGILESLFTVDGFKQSIITTNDGKVCLPLSNIHLFGFFGEEVYKHVIIL